MKRINRLASLAFLADKLTSLLSPTRVCFVNVKSRAAVAVALEQLCTGRPRAHRGRHRRRF